MRSEELRGTVENSDSDCSDCNMFLPDKMGLLWFRDGLDLEKAEAAFVLGSSPGEAASVSLGLLLC